MFFDYQFSVFDEFSAASQSMDWQNECDDESQFFESFDEETIDFPFELNAHDTSFEEAASSNSRKSSKKRGRKSFMTARLAAALDNAKVSDGMAVHILIAAAEALGHRVEDLIVNRSSIHRFRQENRSKESTEISTAFSDSVNSYIYIIAFLHRLNIYFICFPNSSTELVRLSFIGTGNCYQI